MERMIQTSTRTICFRVLTSWNSHSVIRHFCETLNAENFPDVEEPKKERGELTTSHHWALVQLCAPWTSCFIFLQDSSSSGTPPDRELAAQQGKKKKQKKKTTTTKTIKTITMYCKYKCTNAHINTKMKLSIWTEELIKNTRNMFVSLFYAHAHQVS